jgi:hypothetical protein
MTPYTIALAGKAYLTQANCLGKIQQTVGNNFNSPQHVSFNELRVSKLGEKAIGAGILLFKNLQFPHHFSNQPTSIGNRKKGKGISGAFPGIYQNFKAVKTALHSATNRLVEVLNFNWSTSDNAYLTTSFDVIVSKSFSGRGNYKLMPVLHSAR